MARKARPAIDADHVVLGRFDGVEDAGMRMTYVAHQSPVRDYFPRLYLTRLVNGTDPTTVVVRQSDLPMLEAAVAALRSARFETPADGDEPAP